MGSIYVVQDQRIEQITNNCKQKHNFIAQPTVYGNNKWVRLHYLTATPTAAGPLVDR